MLLYNADNPAPNPRRVRIYLAEKGLSVPSETLSIVAGEHKSEAFLAVNPLGQLPALVLDDGSVLLEAAAIAQYIADRDSTAKLAPPHGTIERARLQAWLNFLSSEMHKGGLGPLFYTALDERAKDVFRERLRARFAFVDQHLSTREYLLGKDYSIADVGLYAITGWTPRVGFDIHAYPNLVAHQARIAGRDAVREVHGIEGPVPA